MEKLYKRYIELKNRYMSYINMKGGGPPNVTSLKGIGLFTDENMNRYLNPVYGFIYSSTNFLTNCYVLGEMFNADRRVIKLIRNVLYKISDAIPIDITIELKQNIKPRDMGRFLAYRYSIQFMHGAVIKDLKDKIHSLEKAIKDISGLDTFKGREKEFTDQVIKAEAELGEAQKTGKPDEELRGIKRRINKGNKALTGIKRKMAIIEAFIDKCLADKCSAYQVEGSPLVIPEGLTDVNELKSILSEYVKVLNSRLVIYLTEPEYSNNVIPEYFVKRGGWRADVRSHEYYYIALAVMWRTAGSKVGIEEYYMGVNDVLSRYGNNVVIPADFRDDMFVVEDILPKSNPEPQSDDEGWMSGDNDDYMYGGAAEAFYEELAKMYISKNRIQLSGQEYVYLLQPIKYKFPDCGEISLRNFILILITDSNGTFDLSVLDGYGAVEEVKEYFRRYPTNLVVADDKRRSDYKRGIVGNENGSTSRDAWGLLTVNLPKVRYEHTIGQGESAINVELSDGMVEIDMEGEDGGIKREIPNILLAIRRLFKNVKEFEDFNNDNIYIDCKLDEDGYGTVTVTNNHLGTYVWEFMRGHYEFTPEEADVSPDLGRLSEEEKRYVYMFDIITSEDVIKTVTEDYTSDEWLYHSIKDNTDMLNILNRAGDDDRMLSDQIYGRMVDYAFEHFDDDKIRRLDVIGYRLAAHDDISRTKERPYTRDMYNPVVVSSNWHSWKRTVDNGYKGLPELIDLINTHEIEDISMDIGGRDISIDNNIPPVPSLKRLHIRIMGDDTRYGRSDGKAVLRDISQFTKLECLSVEAREGISLTDMRVSETLKVLKINIAFIDETRPLRLPILDVLHFNAINFTNKKDNTKRLRILLDTTRPKELYLGRIAIFAMEDASMNIPYIKRLCFQKKSNIDGLYDICERAENVESIRMGVEGMTQKEYISYRSRTPRGLRAPLRKFPHLRELEISTPVYFNRSYETLVVLETLTLDDLDESDILKLTSLKVLKLSRFSETDIKKIEGMNIETLSLVGDKNKSFFTRYNHVLMSIPSSLKHLSISTNREDAGMVFMNDHGLVSLKSNIPVYCHRSSLPETSVMESLHVKEFHAYSVTPGHPGPHTHMSFEYVRRMRKRINIAGYRALRSLLVPKNMLLRDILADPGDLNIEEIIINDDYVKYPVSSAESTDFPEDDNVLVKLPTLKRLVIVTSTFRKDMKYICKGLERLPKLEYLRVSDDSYLNEAHRTIKRLAKLAPRYAAQQ